MSSAYTILSQQKNKSKVSTFSKQNDKNEKSSSEQNQIDAGGAGAFETDQTDQSPDEDLNKSEKESNSTLRFNIEDITGDKIYPLAFSAGIHKITIVKKSVYMVRLMGLIFDTNKCFLLPHAIPGIKSIIEMQRSLPEAQMLIVGHAGRDEDLAGLDMALERSEILSAYLKNKPDVWLNWFSTKKENRVRWGTREIQLMLSILPDTANPFYKGFASGITDNTTTEAIKAFQQYANSKPEANLSISGKADSTTCKMLVQYYMQIENTTLEQNIVPETHGCEGHFKAALTAEGAEPDDRRLEIFFFSKGINPVPAGKTSEEGSAEYPSWVSNVCSIKDFENHGIHIQIVDSRKIPVPEANVVLKGPIEAKAISDQHGYVSFFGLKPGEYLVHSEKKGYKIGDSKLIYPLSKTVPGIGPVIKKS